MAGPGGVLQPAPCSTLQQRIRSSAIPLTSIRRRTDPRHKPDARSSLSGSASTLRGPRPRFHFPPAPAASRDRSPILVVGGQEVEEAEQPLFYEEQARPDRHRRAADRGSRCRYQRPQQAGGGERPPPPARRSQLGSLLASRSGRIEAATTTRSTCGLVRRRAWTPLSTWQRGACRGRTVRLNSPGSPGRHQILPHSFVPPEDVRGLARPRPLPAERLTQARTARRTGARSCWRTRT